MEMQVTDLAQALGDNVRQLMCGCACDSGEVVLITKNTVQKYLTRLDRKCQLLSESKTFLDLFWQGRGKS